MSAFGFPNTFLAPQIRAVSRAAFSRLNPRQLNAGSALSVPLAPLAPLILVGSALLYQQGGESSQHGEGDPDFWKKVLAESALSYAVLRTTTGIYPLLGIGLCAYRAGQKNTVAEKVQALVNTASTMMLGWAGVHLFESFSEAGRENDDYIIHNALQGRGRHEAAFKQWVDTHLTELAKTNENAEGLKNALIRLRFALTDKANLARKKLSEGPLSEQMSALKEKVSALKAEASDWHTKLGQATFSDHHQKVIVQSALEKLGDSQSAFTRITRMMNPLYGYIIMGLMLGAPLAKWIGSRLNARIKPDLQDKTFQQPLFPRDHRLLNPDDEHESSHVAAGQHGGHANHFTSPGPSIIWPDVNGGRPMQ